MDSSGISQTNLDPISIMQQEALEMSGMSYERAFAIDKANIGATMDSSTLLQLCEIFYGKVLKCSNEKLK